MLPSYYAKTYTVLKPAILLLQRTSTGSRFHDIQLYQGYALSWNDTPSVVGKLAVSCPIYYVKVKFIKLR